MPALRIDGRSIDYTDQGTGPAVLLIHGFPLDRRVWNAQIAGLSDRFRVIAPDLPGFGKSTTDGPFTIESLAKDMEALLHQMGVSPCVVAGLSMGGYVALAYEQLRPTDLQGLILVDTKAEADSTEAKANRQTMIELARTAGSKAVAGQMLPKMVSADTVARRPQLVRELRAMMEACPAQTIEYAQLAMCDRADRTGNLPSIANPTLIIVGQEDAITPATLAEGMHRAIPRSKLAIIPNAGHMSPVEQPAAVTQCMRGFLDECYRG